MKPFYKNSLILMAITCIPLFAQAPDVLWAHEYGTGAGWNVRETRDHGYVLSGTDGPNIRVVRTDIDGNTVWNRTYPLSGTDDIGASVIETPDSEFIIIGRVYISEGDMDLIIMRLKKNGDVLWTKQYGTDTTYDQGWNIQAVADGNYIIGGEQWLPIAGQGTPLQCDNYLVKINPSGDTLWTKHWGYGYDTDEEVWSVQPALDGGYAVAGYAADWGTHVDAFLDKTDPNGDSQWFNHYGGNNADAGWYLIGTPDSGYVIVGETSSYGSGSSDFYIIKTDKTGAVQWYRTYGGALNEIAYTIDKMPDGGFVIGGETSSFGSGGTDIWLIRTDSSGDTLWTKTVGGSYDETCWSLQRTYNDCFILAGIKDGSIYLVKLGPDQTAIENSTTGSDPAPFFAYPNPCNSFVNIKFNGLHTDNPTSIKIALYDVTGSLLRTIESKNSKSMTFSLKDNYGDELPMGTYFLRLVSAQNHTGGCSVMIKKIR
jgi:hypothetical protein